jgi:hypothetical protein
MASLIIVMVAVTVAGVMFVVYLGICFAIAREDHRKWSLRSKPTTFSHQAARFLVGITGTRRD